MFNEYINYWWLHTIEGQTAWWDPNTKRSQITPHRRRIEDCVDIVVVVVVVGVAATTNWVGHPVFTNSNVVLLR